MNGFMSKAFLGLRSVTAIGVLWSATGFAHAHLKSAEPQANAVVSSTPHQITLHCSEALESSMCKEWNYEQQIRRMIFATLFISLDSSTD